MRFMILIKADENTEAGVMPSEAMLTEMGRFNEELAKAGIMLGGDGLTPSSRGARVLFTGDGQTVVPGPFRETRQLVCGFWLWECRSLEEAIAWVRRCPKPLLGDAEIEIRPLFEMEDFGSELTPELREQEARLRVAAEDRARSRGN
ncbi:YciI family protein [Methyloterricola oryzae]|uniref:YciI family protein n=1 Tax=Methyloterricola oryzae TaxID=1495050 RepID=UPI0005EB05E3|nr:YciI family protein [Methyloterricola oryzae]